MTIGLDPGEIQQVISSRLKKEAIDPKVAAAIGHVIALTFHENNLLIEKKLLAAGLSI